MSESKEHCTPKINLKFSGSFDLGEVSEMVLIREIKKGENIDELYMNVAPETKSHGNLRHTTTIETLGYIVNSHTLRCSSLSSANLNDEREKERVSVERFAYGRFISCFSHMAHESVGFWSMYGVKERNVQLVLKTLLISFAMPFTRTIVCLRAV
jgi:hypothetical protein